MIEFKNDINRISEKELAELLIDRFVKSPERKLMLDAKAYYVVDNPEIMHRKMYRYQTDKLTGEIRRIEDNAKPNNKRAHGFMYLLVEDKINYLLSKPYTLTCEKSEEYLKRITTILGESFQEQRIMRLGELASNTGCGWLHPYINGNGELKTMVIPADQCIPGWIDNDHEEMSDFIWFYAVDIIEGKELKTVLKVEYWTAEGVAYYVSAGSIEGTSSPVSGGLILDSERYLNAPDGTGEFIGHFMYDDNTEGSWGRIPFIPFKNNNHELPDLKFVRELIDAYDKGRSDVGNYLDEVKNIIYALRGYGGTDLGEFMRDLNYFRAISLDEDGGAEAITPDIDITAAKEDYDQLRKDIFTFGQGVDKDADKLGNSPSGIALKFMYSGLDLKCNRMEAAFKYGWKQLMWFVARYLELTSQGADYDAAIEITFNRDININESQAITDCQNSKGIISDETIVENHPWVKDATVELNRLKQQEQEVQGKISDMLPINEDE